MTHPSAQQLANLDAFLATPAIITQEMTPEQIRGEYERMCLRTLITRDFVDGRVDPDFFENAMHELGVDIYHCQEQWDDGERFI